MVIGGLGLLVLVWVVLMAPYCLFAACCLLSKWGTVLTVLQCTCCGLRLFVAYLRCASLHFQCPVITACLFLTGFCIQGLNPTWSSPIGGLVAPCHGVFISLVVDGAQPQQVCIGFHPLLLTLRLKNLAAKISGCQIQTQEDKKYNLLWRTSVLNVRQLIMETSH